MYVSKYVIHIIMHGNAWDANTGHPDHETNQNCFSWKRNKMTVGTEIPSQFIDGHRSPIGPINGD